MSNILLSLKGGVIFMRVSVIEYDNDERVFYNLGVFNKCEDLIVFPYTEFDRFYDEIESRIRCLRNIVNEVYQKSEDPPEHLRHIEPHLQALEKEIKDLIDFEVQTSLESFNEKPKKITKPKKLILDLEVEPIQCLIGL
jgi:hypothetical protein